MLRSFGSMIFILAVVLGVFTATSKMSCSFSDRFPASANQCNELFDSQKNEIVVSKTKPGEITNRIYNEQRQGSISSGRHYTSQIKYEARVGAVVSGHYKAWITDEVRIPYLEKTSIISRLENVSVGEDVNLPAPPEAGTLELDVLDAIDFVIQNYRERRPHWSPDFLVKLRGIAKEYLPESTYITVRDSMYKGKIVGTLRLIRERDGHLPLERYLGISIQTNGELKVEPGNFAIEKSESQSAWPEIMMQLASAKVKGLTPGRPNHYVTYADRYSKLLYAGLGFRPVSLERMTISPDTRFTVVTEVIDGKQIQYAKILKDGTEWTPMEASQTELDQLLDLHLARIKARDHHADEISSLESRREDLGRTRADLRVVSRSVHFQGEIYRGWYMLGSYDPTRIQVNLFIERWDGTDWQHVNNKFLGEVFQRAIPLKNGYQEKTMPFMSSLYYSEGNFIYRPHEDLEFRMKGPPDLSYLTQISLPKYGHLSGLTFDF